MWRPRAHAQTDPYRVTQWARTHTPKDALFLVPPSTDWFRSYAFRSVVFNHKPTPFRDAAMHERLARLRTVAPAPLPDRADRSWLVTLDSAYHARSTAEWIALADRFDADYAVVHEPQVSRQPPGDLVFRSGEWALYHLSP